jgi:hypothetical protein
MIARRSSKFIAPLLALAIGGVSSTAFAADEVGTAGLASKLELSSTSADQYLQYHGSVMIGTDSYRWGGTSCGSRTLSPENVQLLAYAVRGAKKITPRYQLGQASARCLVGFAIDF